LLRSFETASAMLCRFNGNEEVDVDVEIGIGRDKGAINGAEEVCCSV